jgi:subtilisin family serine protease
MKKLALAGWWLCLSSLSAYAVEGGPSAASFAPGEIIVKFKKDPAGAQKSKDKLVPEELDLPADLKSVNKKHGVKSLEKVFKDKAEAPGFVGKGERRKKRAPGGAEKARGLEEGFTRTFKLTFDPSLNVEEVLRDYRAHPDVEYAEPNGIATVQLVPNDPYYSSSGTWGQSYKDLYGLHITSAAPAWDMSTGTGVVVAVVDTGIDSRHPDLKVNMWVNPGEVPGNGVDDDANGCVDDVHGCDFVLGQDGVIDGNPADGHGHGTHVAGTIAAAANNSVGILGLAFESRVMAVKGLSDGGSGTYQDLANALRYAADMGADVINNSWGGTGSSQLLKDAVDYAHSLGAVVVAAAGNYNQDVSAGPFIPAAYPNVIAVAAFDAFDKKASFSNYGNKIDVAAPGVDILSLRSTGTTLGSVVGTDYVRASGTSMASPHAAALAALILAQHPEYTNEEVRSVLRLSSDDVAAPGFDPHSGYGRINAFRAMNTAPDLIPPQAAIVFPAPGTVLSGTVQVSGTASDSSEVVKVELAADSAPFSAAAGTGAWTYALDTFALANGTHTLVARATDKAGNKAFVLVDVSVFNPGNNLAVYDAALRAPKCGDAGVVCDSAGLLNGRGTMAGGAEPNQPNTLHGSCADGSRGTYHVDESNDRIRVRSLDGTTMAAGKILEIVSTVWVYSSSSNYLDLYYTASVSSPAWVFAGTLRPAATGQQVLAATHTLRSGGLHAVRAVFRFNGSAAICALDSYRDNDDLVFAAEGDPDTIPPAVFISSPADGATVYDMATVKAEASDDGGVARVEFFVDGALSYTDLARPFEFVWYAGGVSQGTHTLTARAVDSSANAASHSITVNVADVRAPGIFSVRASSVGTTSAVIQWSTDEPADSQVEYGTSTAYGLSTPVDGVLVTSHAVALAGLAEKTVYHYRVRSKDTAGNVSVSEDRTFRTLDKTAPAISGVAATNVGKSGATIVWSTNEPADTQVEYGLTTGLGSWTALNTSLVTSHSVGLSGLSRKRTYYYRVRSRDAAGNLAVSSTYSFVTRP